MAYYVLISLYIFIHFYTVTYTNKKYCFCLNEKLNNKVLNCFTLQKPIDYCRNCYWKVSIWINMNSDIFWSFYLNTFFGISIGFITHLSLCTCYDYVLLNLSLNCVFKLKIRKLVSDHCSWYSIIIQTDIL